MKNSFKFCFYFCFKITNKYL